MKTYRDESSTRKIITRRRQELALTQTELARRLGYPNVNFISQVESGKSKMPVEKAAEVAVALEIDKKWFAECVLLERFPTIA
jgi:transcriptional regulator with XRE-family HTH domain